VTVMSFMGEAYGPDSLVRKVQAKGKQQSFLT